MSVPKRLSDYVAEEVATHGEVRLPWEVFSGVHPFDIAWRMGAGEHQIRMLGYVVGQLDVEERIERVKRAGAVPADWVWWVADYAELFAGDPEASETFGAYDHPFEDVRPMLEARGLVVVGTPSDGAS